jgi:hypothetical protein
MFWDKNHPKCKFFMKVNVSTCLMRYHIYHLEIMWKSVIFKLRPQQCSRRAVGTHYMGVLFCVEVWYRPALGAKRKGHSFYIPGIKPRIFHLIALPTEQSK